MLAKKLLKLLKQKTMSKVSCVIAAYNEGPRIENVLRAVVGHPLVDEIIVVDDGSTDNTSAVVKTFNDVRLLVQPKNQGKSRAVYRGISEAQSEFIFLLDADLVGLTAEAITQLLEPVLEGKSEVSISLRGKTVKLWLAIGLDYISGERVFPKKILEGQLDKITTITGFGLEVFLNQLIIKNHCRIKVIFWPNVESPHKHTKYGLWRGIKGEVVMIGDIFKTVSVFGPIYQIIKMLKLRV